MMPMGGTSLFGGLVGLVIVVAILALAAGGALSGSDLLNPKTSDAIWQEKTQAVQSKAAKDATDLEAYRAQKTAEIEKTNSDLASYKAIQAAKVQAEQEKIRQDVEARQRKLEQDLALARRAQEALMTGVKWAILVLSAGVAAFLGQLGYCRLMLARAQTAQYDLWRNPAYREEARRQARQKEVGDREVALAWQSAAQKPTVGGNGKHPPKYGPEPVKALQR